MADGNIPPPHINFNRTEINFSEEMAFISSENNFRDYLTKSKEQVEKDRKTIEEEAEKQQNKLKSSKDYEKMQAKIRSQQDLEKAQIEEDEIGEFEEDDEERLLRKDQESKTKGKKGLKGKDNLVEEEMKGIKNNKAIGEDGDELEVPTEEDPLKMMEQEALSDEDVDCDALKESKDVDENRAAETKKTKESKTEKSDSEKNEKTESKDVSDSKGMNKGAQSKQSQSIAANIASVNSPTLQSQQVSTAKTNSFKSSDLQELEAMASQLISEAKVLENGDVIETTITLNLEKSIFDKGEVTVTAYKYRPLEVNLKFKKFNHEATALMQKKSDDLKKVLKRKSLKVHQLEIIE